MKGKNIKHTYWTNPSEVMRYFRETNYAITMLENISAKWKKYLIVNGCAVCRISDTNIFIVTNPLYNYECN